MPPLPAVPDGFDVRPLTADDAAAVAALLVSAEPQDDTGEYPDAEDLHEWWSGWGLEFERDGVAVLGADGRLAGFATVLASPTFRDAYRIHLEGRIHPDERGRGIGRALLDWQLARGREVHVERHPEAPARLVVEVPGSLPPLERLAAGAGMAAERWYRSMERPLTDLPEVRELDGVRLAGFAADRDDEVRRAHNAAFTEHHGSSERDPGTWERLYTGQRAFRPDLSVLALRDDVVVGYVLAYVYEADAAVRGYREAHYGQIGVLPEARGRGVASALIARALRLAAEGGCARAALDVDSENVTGALRLYEALGFGTVRTRVSWSLSLPPVRAD
ncbi:GNAT family N-acetyltransferase [Blastococcus sp. LR1]|uniref:GNAT family N-acetyltransferase n=1 Tax=Blastococcus sp. LR1 TaxID=2877000 RepID=UPI001CD0069D|nr:GNAT family N-acetyltransferase [Blastococcus sp. LR1]MCA0144310.1 GNAT family N-acetyltransferase [Blastococcus sp. LR1]